MLNRNHFSKKNPIVRRRDSDHEPASDSISKWHHSWSLLDANVFNGVATGWTVGLFLNLSSYIISEFWAFCSLRRPGPIQDKSKENNRVADPLMAAGHL